MSTDRQLPADPEHQRRGHLELLRAEAGYARERLALYRQKRYSGRDTSEVRMRELERASALAEMRLTKART